jgi:23S rRNA (pseudouridine1915-N3)-methyltransferase
VPGLRIIWVGKTKKGFPESGVATYTKRIRPLCALECVEIRAASHSGRDPQTTLKTESEAILNRLDGREAVVLLDEGGKERSSREWADMMRDLLERSQAPATFVLGGAFGVDQRVRERATEVVSLSRLTFPHQLARIILLEQIYRALTLLAGHAYHHE